MYPPIFEICSADSDVQTNIGVSPCRLYPFGEAPENVSMPYVVWQVVGGSPENCISSSPDMDSWSLQVDVYGLTGKSVRDVAQALRNAIESYAHITRWGEQGRDMDTKSYRYSFDVDWWVDRDTQS